MKEFTASLGGYILFAVTLLVGGAYLFFTASPSKSNKVEPWKPGQEDNSAFEYYKFLDPNCGLRANASGSSNVTNEEQTTVEGTPVMQGNQPWFLSIGYQDTNDNIIYEGQTISALHILCGGSLIARQWGLTSGDCVDRLVNKTKPEKLKPFEKVKPSGKLSFAVAGATSDFEVYKSLEVEEKFRRIKSNVKPSQGDLALLRLDSPFSVPQYSKDNTKILINTICLPLPSDWRDNPGDQTFEFLGMAYGSNQVKQRDFAWTCKTACSDCRDNLLEISFCRNVTLTAPSKEPTFCAKEQGGPLLTSHRGDGTRAFQIGVASRVDSFSLKKSNWAGQCIFNFETHFVNLTSHAAWISETIGNYKETI